MDKREKLKLLAKKRQESIIENRKQMTKESPVQQNKKQEMLKKEALELLEQKQAKEAGVDYERIKNRNYSIQDVERWNSKQKVKDDGFTDFIQVAAKSYDKKIRNLQVKQEKYLESLQNTELHHIPSQEALANLSNSVKESKNKKRKEDESADVTFINNRNMHFNKKLARSYDKFTKEIRDNLERGTAL